MLKDSARVSQRNFFHSSADGTGGGGRGGYRHRGLYQHSNRRGRTRTAKDTGAPDGATSADHIWRPHGSTLAQGGRSRKTGCLVGIWINHAKQAKSRGAMRSDGKNNSTFIE